MKIKDDADFAIEGTKQCGPVFGSDYGCDDFFI